MQHKSKKDKKDKKKKDKKKKKKDKKKDKERGSEGNLNDQCGSHGFIRVAEKYHKQDEFRTWLSGLSSAAFLSLTCRASSWGARGFPLQEGPARHIHAVPPL